MGPEKFIEDFGAPYHPTRFVVRKDYKGTEEVTVPGASLRDVFAMKIVAGMLANPTTDPDRLNPDMLASYSYELADAMLRARDV